MIASEIWERASPQILEATRSWGTSALTGRLSALASAALD